MPTYEYECQNCGHKFEKFQYMTDKPIKMCPKCDKSKAKRLISAGSGIIFKGNGFYQTDYKDTSKKSEGKPDENTKSCPKNDTCSLCT